MIEKLTLRHALPRETGTVVGAKQYLLFLEGLPSVIPHAVLTDEDGNRALVTGFDAERVNAVLLDNVAVTIGHRFFQENEGVRVPRPEAILGRIISPIGVALDGRGDLPLGESLLAFEVVAPGIAAREEIKEQFITGVAMIDTLLPIGRGQRELIIGPARSGKVTFVRDAIVNQRGQGTICVYAAIGKPAITIKRLGEDLIAHGAGDYTVIIAAVAGSSTPLVTLVPDMAFAVAEQYVRAGKHVLLVLDDLATHAKYIRELSLLAGQTPGRESYPGDIFYRHAHLMERAGNFNTSAGGGSITLLPILETDLESMTDLIPTNTMASTDGHLFFSAERRAQGEYPAVEVARSVTRVGRRTQFRAQKELADRIIALLAAYDERRTYSRFGAELSLETKRMLTQAEIVMELLKQETGTSIDPRAETVVLALAFTPFFGDRTATFVHGCKKDLEEAARTLPEVVSLIKLIETGASFDEFLSVLQTNTAPFAKVCHP
jgi:F-type H+-transporting ATPase subunit alpha